MDLVLGEVAGCRLSDGENVTKLPGRVKHDTLARAVWRTGLAEQLVRIDDAREVHRCCGADLTGRRQSLRPVGDNTTTTCHGSGCCRSCEGVDDVLISTTSKGIHDRVRVAILWVHHAPQCVLIRHEYSSV